MALNWLMRRFQTQRIKDQRYIMFFLIGLGQVFLFKRFNTISYYFHAAIVVLQKFLCHERGQTEK